jgi:hypothetical protein
MSSENNSNPEMIKWTLLPPPGMRFVNELGSGVTLQFEKGRETECFQALTIQLNQLIQASLKASVIEQAKTTTPPLPMPLGLDSDGNIIRKTEN